MIMSKHERNMMRLEIIVINQSRYVVHGIEITDLKSEIEFFQKCYRTGILLLTLREEL